MSRPEGPVLLVAPMFLTLMQISSTHTYPLARTLLSPALRHDEAWTGETPAVLPAPAPNRPAAVGLPDDMQQARLRGRLFETGGSFATRQALAQYADVARQDELRAQVEVLGINAYV